VDRNLVQKEATCHDLVGRDEDGGVRLDLFVARAVEGLTRSQAKRLIEEGNVSVDGHVAKAAHAVASGERIRIVVPPPLVPIAEPEEIPLDVLYEDRDIIVVSKPAGMVVHPAPGHPAGTLVNALLAHCKDLSGIGGELRAGIVHRLDLGTSGVMIAAKNDAAHQSLTAQFAARSVEKYYGALVLGALRGEEGSFDAPLGRSRGDRKRISAHTRKGRIALTEWKVLERFERALTWALVRIRTGRQHQIRVHFAEAGFPLAGDPLYGGKQKAARLPKGLFRDAIAELDRPALHAWRLALDHPRSGERMRFEAPLPPDLVKLLARLRAAEATT
jgi:23S rRNA pseudouridine1911/1915/1917 synthase